MQHVVCPSCGEDVVPRKPERSAWRVVVAFWVFTLAFGIAAYVSPWPLVLIFAWLLLAMLAMRYGMRAISWTCPSCEAQLPSPREARTMV